MGSGRQNKSTRGVNPLLVHEGAEGLNGAFPREHHPRESAPGMAPCFTDGFEIWDQVWIFPGKRKELDALLLV